MTPDVQHKKEMNPSYIILMTLSIAISTVAETLDPPSPIEIRLDSYENVFLEFETEVTRRYTIDYSTNLLTWTTHYLSPFQSQDGTNSIMELGQPVNLRKGFYRVLTSPDIYHPVVRDADRLDDLTMAQSKDGNLFFAYQNWVDDEVFFVQLSDTTNFISESVATTPDWWWGNTSYSDLVLKIAPDNTPFIICSDYRADKVVCFWKPTNTNTWLRQEVSSSLEARLAYCKFDISDSGVLGVVYRCTDGSYFAYSSYTNPLSWIEFKISDEIPPGEYDTEVLFISNQKALVQCREDLVIDISSQTATNQLIPGFLQPVRSAQGSIVSTSGNTHDWIYIYRSDDNGETWITSYLDFEEDFYSLSVNFSSDGHLNLVVDKSASVEIYRALDFEGAQWETKRISSYTAEAHDKHFLRNNKINVILHDIYDGFNYYIEN